ncbi:hypothetical protein CGMCC3_g14240 [Colletotrichum fructicola]|nr:uncharacterized protein CGMCC3_g14240 [Colletotrichum fructicola]KAE9569679.1 hypothetical protein CGMCC3_g14240 [Colletotrichum fructicola]
MKHFPLLPAQNVVVVLVHVVYMAANEVAGL